MKISVNTINRLNKDYASLNEPLELSPEELSAKIWSQLGAVEAVIDIAKRYQGIVIAKVVSCDKHPNADRLHVCLIDDGQAIKDVSRTDQGLVQVVCGAPNVKQGLTVAWLPPGATVPETVDKEPFVLEARDLRGIVSNGMLASPKELALGDDHDGILEIDGDHRPGEDFAAVFGLKDDAVIDIENKMFTHRPDCFGFLGVAREIAGINHVSYKSPAWYQQTPNLSGIATNSLPLKVINELPELVPRFTALAIANVKVAASPVWLQVELAKVGLRPINNIVDLTNWYMLLTSQPLHAYDYDKVKALSNNEATLIVRRPKPSEKLKLLNGKDIAPRAEAILIATDKQAIGLGGIMGGLDTEVSDSTKNIILECANFDMYSIRRSSMEHGLFSDAVTRFTKGQSPLQNLSVILKIADDVTSIAGGQVASQLIDDNQLDPEVMARGSLHPSVTVNVDFINTRLGLDLDDSQIKQLLENVEFKVTTTGQELIFSAPFWRTDIELPEDIVEEVGRLYGYDKLPLKLPARDLTPALKDTLLSAKAVIRTKLSTMGANEVLTYSFIHGDLMAKVGQDKAKAYKIGNALRPELQYYRVSLMPSLLDKVHPNVKAGYDKFALFEIAKAHNIDSVDSDGLPEEHELTGLVVSRADKLNLDASAYYEAKLYLSQLCGDTPLEFRPLTAGASDTAIAKPYEPQRAALVYLKESNEFLGLIGEFSSSTRQALKLPRYCAGFEIDTNVLAKAISQPKRYMALSRFPGVTQDISLRVPADVSYQMLLDSVTEAVQQFKPDDTIFSLEPRDIYQGEAKDYKNITFRLKLVSYNRTLTDQEASSLLDKVASQVNISVKAERL